MATPVPTSGAAAAAVSAAPPAAARPGLAAVIEHERYRSIVARLAGAQKLRTRGAPAYSVYVNRKAGRHLAAVAYRFGLTPNTVTVISALFTFSGIAMIATLPPSWWLGIAVWLALAVGYAFDSADGQVARLRGGGSPSGEWLDHIVDATKISSLHLAVLVSMYRFFDLPDPRLLLVPIGYAVVAAVAFFAIILNEQLRRVYGAGRPVPGSHSTVLRSLLALPTDYGLFCMIFLLLGAPALFFVAYGLMFAANTGHLLIGSVKWFHDLDRLASEGAGPEAEIGAETGAETGAEKGPEVEADAGIGTGAGADADTQIGTDARTDADAPLGTGIRIETDTRIGTGTGTEADTRIGTDVRTETGVGIETWAEPRVAPCQEASALRPPWDH